MAITKVTSGGISDIAAAVEGASDSNKFTDADHSKLDGVAASANNYVHPNHSGDVVSAADGAMTIQTDAVDIAMLSATGTPGSTTFLRGDNAWATAGSTGIDDNSDATAITIDSSENVGIGTTSPTSGYKLDVNGKIIISQGDAEIRFNSGGGWIGNSAEANTVVIGTSGSERMRIDSTGAVTKPNQPSFRVGGTNGESGAGTVVKHTTTYHNTDLFAIACAGEASSFSKHLGGSARCCPRCAHATPGVEGLARISDTLHPLPSL